MDGVELQRLYKSPLLFSESFFGWNRAPFRARLVQRAILRDPANRLLVSAPRRSGKSLGLAARALHAALTAANQEILYVAYSWALGQCWREQLQTLLHQIPELPGDTPLVQANTERQLVLGNGSRISWLSFQRRPEVFHGRRADLLLCDEPYFAQPEAWQSAHPIIHQAREVVLVGTPHEREPAPYLQSLHTHPAWEVLQVPPEPGRPHFGRYPHFPGLPA